MFTRLGVSCTAGSQIFRTENARIYRSAQKSYCSQVKFCGRDFPLTTNLAVIRPEMLQTIPVYRVMDNGGKIINPGYQPELSTKILLDMYNKVITLNTYDKIMYDSQRQGRISFYMTHYGEEAIQLGTAAALDDEDFIYGQYREVGVLLWRGLPLEQLIDQCFCNSGDPKKGRQMPIHYGSKEHHYSTISSPLATQIPIAVGSAYSFKLSGDKKAVVCYFGDGASSEGDAFTGFNFASVLDCPIIFICRNNGYAISMPVDEQYRGDGIVSRAASLGMLGIRVDGNDIFAMYNATKLARELCLAESRPVLIEAMTYRVGHHSTSDDSSAYRSTDEVNSWINDNNPIVRFRNYLLNSGLLREDEEEELRVKSRKQILEALIHCEAKKKPNPLLMFTDVYSKQPQRIHRQMLNAKAHLEKHNAQYDLCKFDPLTIPTTE